MTEHQSGDSDPDPQLELKPGAFGSIRSFSGEYLTALAFFQHGDRARLHGGQQAMFDIATDPYYTDVKVLLRMTDSDIRKAHEEDNTASYEWMLHMPTGGAFTKEKVTKTRGVYRRTHLGLVRLIAKYSATWDGCKLVTEVEPEKFLCSWIPTDDVNAAIEGCGQKYCWLPTPWLDSFITYEIQVGVPGPTHTAVW
jgi:hypothetical protein